MTFEQRRPKYLLVIRGHSRQSAVMLFDELLNETAVPRIHANVHRSPGAARRIVVRDPLKSPTQKHEEPKKSWLGDDTTSDKAAS